MGEISDLLGDDKHTRIRFVEVTHCGFLRIFGSETFILPSNMITEVEEHKVHVTYTAEEVDPEASYIPELEEGDDTDPAGWFKQSPGGLPRVAIQ